jgi:hypothetical protein
VPLPYEDARPAATASPEQVLAIARQEAGCETLFALGGKQGSATAWREHGETGLRHGGLPAGDGGARAQETGCYRRISVLHGR